MFHYTEVHEHCNLCMRFFADEDALHSHRATRHGAAYCPECRWIFTSPANLEAHRRSEVHQPKDTPCIMQSLGCAQTFVSRSAMLGHLEMGVCPSGATRVLLSAAAVAADADTHLLTVPRRSLTNRTIEVTDDMYDARARRWVCTCRRTFRAAAHLQKHLASPAHDARLFRCPQCARETATLSGTVQHIESAQCGAAHAFAEEVAQFASRLRHELSP